MKLRDPYLIVLAALWAWLPFLALRFWLAWDELPRRMATHFDDAWRANGWSTKSEAVELAIGVVLFALLIVTPVCYWTRAQKPSHSWAVLVVAHMAVGFVGWNAGSILSHNLP